MSGCARFWTGWIARVSGSAPPLVDANACAQLANLYEDAEETLRSTINMARYGFGSGEYKYFCAPLPPIIQRLREKLYKRLAPVANEWMPAQQTRDKISPPPPVTAKYNDIVIPPPEFPALGGYDNGDQIYVRPTDPAFAPVVPPRAVLRVPGDRGTAFPTPTTIIRPPQNAWKNKVSRRFAFVTMRMVT